MILILENNENGFKDFKNKINELEFNNNIKYIYNNINFSDYENWFYGLQKRLNEKNKIKKFSLSLDNGNYVGYYINKWIKSDDNLNDKEFEEIIKEDRKNKLNRIIYNK